MNDDDELRDLLRETADGITPRGGYEEIKERAMNENSSRKWVLPSLAAAAAMVLVVGGLGWMLRDDGKAPDVAGPPTSDASATESPQDPPMTEKSVDVFYLGDTPNGPRLFSEKHRLQANSPYAFGQGAIGDAVGATPRDPDYYSAWPEGVSLASSTAEEPGVVDINVIRGTDVSRPAGMTEAVARLSLEQVVRSFQAGAEKPVKLRFFWSEQVDGGEQMTDDQVTEIFGIDTSEPLGTSPDDDVLAPVQITSLVDGQKVPAGKLTVSGVAAAFEANVLWELEDSTGSTIEESFTTAAECCTLAPYSFDLDLEPGTYTIVVHDEDVSGENRPVNEDTKRIVVE